MIVYTTCFKNWNRVSAFILFVISLYPLTGLEHLDSLSPFALETRQIILSEYPDAFNPSIIRWKGRLLLSFRNIANQKDSYNSSQIGLVYLDDHFHPTSRPELLPLTNTGRAEDARLIEVGGKLYMVYSDNEDLLITKGGFRVYVAEIIESQGKFSWVSKDRLSPFPQENPSLREKNWTPFNYQGLLLLSYSLNPHLVFRPYLGDHFVDTVAYTNQKLDWKWGEIRGGTPSLLVDGCYLTFFHSSVMMSSKHSGGKPMLHYFMGACTFDCDPPFEMLQISKSPIRGQGFLEGPYYKPYWGSWRGVFPGGFFVDDATIYVVYGKQNHEMWVVLIDKQGLLDSLKPISK